MTKYHFKNSFFGRHECIPKNTRLIKIAKSEVDEITGMERKIFWFVPEEFYDRYLEDCQRYPDRIIEVLTKEEPLPSWNLDGYNLTKQEKERIRRGSNNKVDEDIIKSNLEIKEIKSFTEKEYLGAFSTNQIVKIEDGDIRKKVLFSQGIDPNANIEVFLIENEDKEMGGQVYQLYMKDKKGNIKIVNLPTCSGKRQLIANQEIIAQDSKGNKILSKGNIKDSPLSWLLPDGTELNVLIGNNRLEIGKTNISKTNTLKSRCLLHKDNSIEKDL